MGKGRQFPKTISMGFLTIFTAVISLLPIISSCGGEKKEVSIRALGQIGGAAKSIAFNENIAYIGVGPRVIAFEMLGQKISKPVCQSIFFPDLVNDIAISGKYAYASSSGLQILDISNPSNLRRIGFHSAIGRAIGVALFGKYAYLLNEDQENRSKCGIQILDVSNPSSPKQVGFYEIPGFLMHISRKGKYIYIASREEGKDGVRIFTISDPKKPREVKKCGMPGEFIDVHESGNLAYVASKNVLRVLDISNPKEPKELGSCRLGKRWISDLFSRGKYVYVLGDDLPSDPELWVVDVSDPRKPFPISSQKMMGTVMDVGISGNHAYIAEWKRGIRVVDISDPSSPRDVGFYRSGGDAVRLIVSGRYIYLADGEGGFKILDISDRRSPRELGCYKRLGKYIVHFSLPLSSAATIALSGRYAYVGEWFNGLRILDISDPNNPKDVGFFGGLGMVMGVTVSGRYAYIAERGNGLWIIDISNPKEPKKVSFWRSPGWAHGGPYTVIRHGGYLYLADGDAGLRILDISKPGEPKEVGFYTTGKNVIYVGISGRYLYLTENEIGPAGKLRVMDISNAIAPKEIGSYKNKAFLSCPSPIFPRLFDLSSGKQGIALTMGEYGLLLLEIGRALYKSR